MYKIALLQMNLDGNREQNIKKSDEFIKEAVKMGANVICLPELYESFYFCQKENADYFDFAEEKGDVSFTHFSKVAKENNVVIMVPFFEKRALGVYHNSIYMIDADGEQVGLYRKMHIPDDPQYFEKYYFNPGDLGFNSFKNKFGNHGMLICWDQWFPEAARLTAMKGAEVIFYPTAIGWIPSEMGEEGNRQREAWMTVQRGHAIANGIYTASVNRVGFEKREKESEGIQFWGSSFICGPQGEILAQASTDKEEIITADIDLSRIENVRRWWPFFRDRRVEFYGGITEKWGQE